MEEKSIELNKPGAVDITNPHDIRESNKKAKEIIDQQEEVISEIDSLSITLDRLKESSAKLRRRQKHLRTKIDEVMLEL